MNPFKSINKTTNFIYKLLKIIVMLFFIILTWSKVQNVFALETENYIYFSYDKADFKEYMEDRKELLETIDKKVISILKEKNINYIITIDYSKSSTPYLYIWFTDPKEVIDSFYWEHGKIYTGSDKYIITMYGQGMLNGSIKRVKNYNYRFRLDNLDVTDSRFQSAIEFFNDIENFNDYNSSSYIFGSTITRKIDGPIDVIDLSKDFVFVYDSNLPVYYKNYVSSGYTFIPEVKFYKGETLLTVHENDQYPTYKNFTKSEPTFTYEIKDNNNGSKNIIVTFENMSDEYTAKFSNITLGITDEVMTITDNKFTFENIALDSIITINIYKNSTNEIVFTDTIDIKNTQINKKDPYIKINGYNQNNEINNVMYEYINTTSDMKCYYQFADQEEVEESCITQSKKSTQNTFITLKIKENDKIIYQKKINLNFLQNQPQIKFNSYFESINQYQVLIINIFNSQVGDIFEYSTDNQFYQTFTDNPLNLQFYNNTNIYVRVKRNDQIISTGFIEVIYNSFENSNPSGTNDIDDINNIFDLFDSMNNVTHQITIYINNFWSGIVATSITSYILLLVMGTVIILIISAINRK